MASSGSATAATRRGKADSAREHDAQEHGQHLAHVGRQEVAQELADVGEDGTAVAHRCDDGGEIVVGEDHARRLLRDFGAGDPHRDADVGFLQRWCVVDAVAGHGDDVAVLLQRLHDAQLVVRRHARVHRRRAHSGGERRIVHGIELDSGERLSASSHDAEVGSDANCGPRVITGDHEDANARAMRVADRRRGFLARRIYDADRAHEDEIMLEAFVASVRLGERQRAVGDRYRAQRSIGQRIDVRENSGPPTVVERHDVHPFPHSRAASEQDVGSALGDQYRLVPVFAVDLDRRHHLAHEK